MERHHFHVKDPTGREVAVVDSALQAAARVADLGVDATVCHASEPDVAIYREDGEAKTPLYLAFLIWSGYERRRAELAALQARVALQRWAQAAEAERPPPPREDSSGGHKT